MSLVAGVPTADRIVIPAASRSLPTDGASQTVITVQLKDQYRNDVAERDDSRQLVYPEY
ncbi:hypothetical protein [Cohnella sp. REN36]|uniref:hypothetical protein n=1 Tax=Cohnella sp. REN36 TaxID=2887347 RepID=UPI001D139A0E|nr:hypothetical protein [Cohnella sp. REN36]